MTAKLEPDARFVALETRMTGIEDSLKQLVLDFRNRGHIPWGVMITAAGAFAAGLLWVVTTQTGPLGKDLDRTAKVLDVVSARQDVQFDKISTAMAAFVSRADLKDKFEAVDERTRLIAVRRDDWQKVADDRILANKAEIDDVRKTVVPRGEHEQHWAAIDQKVAGEHDAMIRQGVDQQRQIDDLRSRFNDLYSAKDVIRDDHEAIRRLEIENGKPR